jgi:hypothetical protein
VWDVCLLVEREHPTRRPECLEWDVNPAIAPEHS